MAYDYIIFKWKCVCFFSENWSSSTQLKDVWKIKGIVDEPDLFEHSYVELSDDDEQEPVNQKLSSNSDSSEKEDDNDSCDSENSEVCGAIASNKFAALDVSD